MGVRSAVGDDDGDSDRDSLTREVAFDALSNQRRRFVVHELLRRDGEVELRELSRRVAAWENDEPVEEVTSEERRRVYNALQQAHLPKLDEWGVLRYNHARGVVEPAAELNGLRMYLEVVPDEDIPWSRYYLLLGLFGLGLAVADGMEVAFLELLPGTVIAAAVGLLLVCSAAVHEYRNREMRLGRDGPPPEV